MSNSKPPAFRIEVKASTSTVMKVCAGVLAIYFLKRELKD